MGEQPGGPRAFLYTGGRLRAEGSMTAREAGRFAAGRRRARAGCRSTPRPRAARPARARRPTRGVQLVPRAACGAGPLPPRVDDSGVQGAPPQTGARTHFGFDITGPEGTARVLVIDNSAGSLAASDPHQNPREPQQPWLRSALRDARQRQVPAIVVGSRDLSRSLAPEANRAGDGDEIARLLVEEGASAYFFERPNENRSAPIPTGARADDPLVRHRQPGLRRRRSCQSGAPFYGESGILLAELNLALRDSADQPRAGRACG